MISSEKICCATKLLLPSFASSYQTGFDMREQAPGANLLHDSVSGASSLVCSEICFVGACFRSKLPSCVLKFTLQERVSGASSLVCTGWSTYPGASFGSVFQEQAPSCVPAFRLLGVDDPCVRWNLGILVVIKLKQGQRHDCCHGKCTTAVTLFLLWCTFLCQVWRSLL